MQRGTACSKQPLVGGVTKLFQQRPPLRIACVGDEIDRIGTIAADLCPLHHSINAALAQCALHGQRIERGFAVHSLARSKINTEISGARKTGLTETKQCEKIPGILRHNGALHRATQRVEPHLRNTRKHATQINTRARQRVGMKPLKTKLSFNRARHHFEAGDSLLIEFQSCRRRFDVEIIGSKQIGRSGIDRPQSAQRIEIEIGGREIGRHQHSVTG